MTHEQEIELDHLHREAVLARDPICRVCGKEPATDVHHIVYKSQSLAVRNSVKNGLGLGRECHEWAHKNPLKFEMAAEIIIGRSNYQRLKRESKEEKPYMDYQKIKDELDEAIRNPEKRDIFRERRGDGGGDLDQNRKT